MIAGLFFFVDVSAEISSLHDLLIQPSRPSSRLVSFSFRLVLLATQNTSRLLVSIKLAQGTS